MDQIKDAFQKVKQDMDLMREEIFLLKQFLYENRQKLSELDLTMKELSIKLLNFIEDQKKINPTDKQKNSTFPTDILTDDSPFKPLNPQKIGFSTGNEGVPTNKQTNQQTDQQIEKASFNKALEVLNSLDNIKKEIRNKFKRLTEQEFLVFSTICQMAEEGDADYKSISKKLNLTETSIRDYVGRLIKKGIPVEKRRINNKLIQLSISEKLTKIAPLSVIFQLRDL